MFIRLEYNGRIVHEIKSDDIKGELTIGRSQTCTWPVPKEDTVASSRHACLFLKGRTVWLKDLESTNGTFFLGKKIEKRKLVIGDKIGVGNCTLCAEPDKTDGGRIVSELAVLTGKGRGQKKPLNPPKFSIGSDPTSSLVILDMLVSRKHAEIMIKEDNSCWIRDLGSKNGTSVNGMPLRDDKERLLKDGDRIAVAHLELEFHDGAVKRSNKQAWLRMGILAATFVLVLALYWTYQHMRSSADAFVRKARSLASEESFALASGELEKAVNARGAAEAQVSIEDLRRLLSLWETTTTVWRDGKNGLSQGKWVQASRDLGRLQSARQDAWEWNDKAPIEKDNSLRAKQMLDALNHAQSSIVRDDVGYDELAEDNAIVKKALAVVSGDTPVYLVRLKAELVAMSRRQETLLDEGSGLEKALDRLKEDYPPYTEIVAAVVKAQGSTEVALKRRAEVLVEPVKALSVSFGKLNEAAELARDMQFAKAIGMDLKLPHPDACSLDGRVSHARMQGEKVFENLKVKAGQMSFMFGEIEKRIGAGHGDVVGTLEDEAVMSKVLAADSLDGRLPKRSRRDAAGEYDRVLGVEEFYTHLAAMPAAADPIMLSDLPFPTVLSQVREAIQKIETLKRFLDQPDNRWLAGGKVGRELTRLNGLTARRDALVGDLVMKAAAGQDRAALIAGGIVARLTTVAGAGMIKGVTPEEWTAAELKKQREALLRLNNEYTLAAPARQIEIRNEILRNGLPGDPIVRRMWSLRDSASQGQ